MIGQQKGRRSVDVRVGLGVAARKTSPPPDTHKIREPYFILEPNKHGHVPGTD